MLSSHFVSLRKEVQQVEQDNDERSSIPITVRYVRLQAAWDVSANAPTANSKPLSASQNPSPR